MTTALTVNTNAELVTDSVASRLERLTAEWIAFADVQPVTQATYNRALKNFASWIKSNGITEINREVCISYRDSILETLKPSTCRLYFSCVKLFVKFLASKGICPNVADNVKNVKVDNSVHSRAALTVDECKKVFHVMTGGNEKSLRDKAIIGLMMSTGLRTIEIVRLDVGDIERRGKKLFLTVHGKARAGKQDRVVLPAQCSALISSYLKLRGRVDKKSPLFVSTSRRCKNERLQTQTVSRLAKKALVKAGFIGEWYCAHSLRHSFATNAIVAGVDIFNVSKAMRHKSVNVTQIYIHDLAEYENETTATVADLIFQRKEE